MQQQPMDPADEQEQFQRVWERVQSGGESDGAFPPAQQVLPALTQPQPFDAAGFLRAALDDNARRAVLCEGWAQLAPLRRRCREQAKRLAGALYLLQGERYASRRIRQNSAGLLDCCRRLYHDCRRAAGSYEAASRQTEEPELRALFHELAGECRICAQQVRRTVEQMMS